ncbi:DUF58 domain-containing protein [Xanthomonas massiliensis]|uniref:DUF58 domain-containing protein n=1 Tax=Xanthomonas massiliensis TaxID=1720302 RepID=UPI000AD12617|nr:DUF58 domain-containing protein [Xanthomonas massiliensis]
MPAQNPIARAQGEPAAGDGVRPTLAELLALRSLGGKAGQARRGQHGLSGPAPSALRGRGMEYAESREYVAGDDVRHIDWRLTARSGRTHTKLFQAERERLSLIVADTSPALYFGTRTRFKSVQAARAAAVAAWVALAEGDRIGALRSGAMEPAVAPASGMRGVVRVLEALVRWYGAPGAPAPDLEATLARARRLLRPGSRLLVLADPAGAARVPDAQWSALSAHAQVRVVLLVDPLELEPPRASLPFLAGANRLVLDLKAPAVRARWEAAFVAPLQRLRDTLPARGVQVGVLSTTDAADAWRLPRAMGASR